MDDIFYKAPHGGLVQNNAVLLVGCVGAGKSSFINSAQTALTHKTAQLTHVVGGADRPSETKFFKRFPLTDKDGKPVRIQLCDSTGIEDTNTEMMFQSIKNIVMGRVQDETKFAVTGVLGERLSEENFDRTVQTLAIVIDASKLGVMKDYVIFTLQSVVKLCEEQGMYSCGILTNIDKSFPSLTDISSNPDVEVLKDKACAKIGIPKDDILLVSNYEVNEACTPEKDAMILQCLSRMLQLSDMYLSCNSRHIKQLKQNQGSLPTPWRDMSDLSGPDLWEKLPNEKSVLLLLGPSGSGKTSLVNTFASVVSGRFRDRAKSGKPTKDLQAKLISFKTAGTTIHDTPDIETLHENDIKYLIQGNIKERYRMQGNRTPIEDQDMNFIKDPPIDSIPHVLVLVINATVAENIPASQMKGMEQAIETAEDRDMCCSVILTHIDKLDGDVMEDITAADRSRALDKIVKNISKKLCVKTTNVLCIKNLYSEDNLKVPGYNIHVLYALKRLQELAEDTFESWKEHPSFKDKMSSVTALPSTTDPVSSPPCAVGNLKASLPQPTSSSSTPNSAPPPPPQDPPGAPGQQNSTKIPPRPPPKPKMAAAAPPPPPPPPLPTQPPSPS